METAVAQPHHQPHSPHQVDRKFSKSEYRMARVMWRRGCGRNKTESVQVKAPAGDMDLHTIVHLCTGVEVLVKATKPEHDDQAESGEDTTASQNIT